MTGPLVHCHSQEAAVSHIVSRVSSWAKRAHSWVAGGPRLRLQASKTTAAASRQRRRPLTGSILVPVAAGVCVVALARFVQATGVAAGLKMAHFGAAAPALGREAEVQVRDAPPYWTRLVMSVDCILSCCGWWLIMLG